MKGFTVILILLCIYNSLFAQYGEGSLLMHKDMIPVTQANGDTLKYPFAGGMNHCQFGQIDLDMDGRKDLVVFDRHGNKILPFLNKGFPGQTRYEFCSEYTDKFPPIREWVQFQDYNNDGKEDIFTYTTGGIKVFRNESGTSLEFVQVTDPYLVSLQGTALTNILVTYADYPAIADLDQDGDLDILTFWGLGSFVEWHRNMSVEQFGNADSLVFEKTSSCWGRFAEAGESNIIRLDTCSSIGDASVVSSGSKHTGSTLLASDFNSDGLPDLVIGDVDYPTLILLTNGGNQDTALIISQTDVFPNEINPVEVTSFPVINSLDVNNDGFSDLIVSPFEPSQVRSETTKSNWLYLNNSSGGTPLFELLTTGFLQEEMLDFGSGAYPVFLDYNADGLQDLMVGNFGMLDSVAYTPVTGLQCFYVSSLALLENTGTPGKPMFQVVSTDYLGLSDLHMQSLVPSVGDMDKDGDMDLLCGNSKGKFVYLENTAGANQPVNFILNDPAFRQLDAGEFSAPCLVDLDKDGLTDIVSGNREGKLVFFRNTGPFNDPQFENETEFLGGVDVTNSSVSYYGYSVPCFLTREGQLEVLVGSESGNVYAYKGIEHNLDGEFFLYGKLDIENEGIRTGVCISDIDQDGVSDLILGNYSGGLGYYRGMDVVPIGVSEPPRIKESSIHISPNPASGSITIFWDHPEDQNQVTIRIYSMEGRAIREFRARELPCRIDVSDLMSGIYCVTIISSTFKGEGKLVIHRN